MLRPGINCLPDKDEVRTRSGSLTLDPDKSVNCVPAPCRQPFVNNELNNNLKQKQQLNIFFCRQNTVNFLNIFGTVVIIKSNFKLGADKTI